MIIRFLILILTTVIFVTSCSYKSAEDNLLEANKLIDKERYPEAIVELDKAIKAKPGYTEAYLNHGFCNEKLKNFKAAISDYQAILKANPNNTKALFYIGGCKYDLNLFEESIEFYNKALITKGYSLESDTSGKLNITLDLYDNGIIEKAKFDVESNLIFYQRGLSYYQLNKFRKAYHDFKKCLTNSYYLPDCHYMIALCYIESGNKELGCKEFDLAIMCGDTLSIKKKQELCK